MEDCIFCKIVNKEIPAYIIDENDEVIVFLSLENHPLVVTKKHIENVFALDDNLAASIMKEAVKIAKATKIALNTDGINLVQSNGKAAHQDVFHFHMHIKPRWTDDGVNLQWPVNSIDNDQKSETRDKIKSAL